MPKKTFPGKDNKPDQELIIDAPDGYEIYQKHIPTEKTRWKDDKYITWFNAFGVKVKGGPETIDLQDPYTVTLRTRGPGVTLFYQKPDKTPVEIKDLQPAEKGYVKFTLKKGDPPVGQYP